MHGFVCRHSGTAFTSTGRRNAPRDRGARGNALRERRIRPARIGAIYLLALNRSESAIAGVRVNMVGLFAMGDTRSLTVGRHIGRTGAAGCSGGMSSPSSS